MEVEITNAWPEKSKLILPDAGIFIAAVQAESSAMVLNDLVLNPISISTSVDLLDPQ